jgi:formylglycine-generating enzyme required for sulfatase activity
MISHKSVGSVVLLAVAVLAAPGWAADVFDLGGVRDTVTGQWTGLASVEFVRVGDAGNAADADTGYGVVGYEYNMGKYDVTAGQYCEFLNAVAKQSDPYGLYDPSMNVAATGLGCNIIRSGGAGNYRYTVAQDWANRPVNYVSWGDAARFCNWLQKGQPTGVEGTATTETGAYALNGANTDALLMQVTRDLNAKYFIPNLNEWYKAAYFDPNKFGAGQAGYWLVPTKSDSPPINILDPTGTNNANFFDAVGTGTHGYTIDSPYYRTEVGAFASSPGLYGTFDQGGNVVQWTETAVGSSRVAMGSCFANPGALMSKWGSTKGPPTYDSDSLGFCVAMVPEPSSLLMFSLSVAAGLLVWNRRSR